MCITKVIKNLENFIETKETLEPTSGLCDNSLYSLDINMRYALFKTWEYYSGDLTYPVPSTETFDYLCRKDAHINDNKAYYEENQAEAAYASHRVGSMYKGKQLELRLSLAKHCVSSLKYILSNLE